MLLDRVANRLWWQGISADLITYNCAAGLYQIRNGAEIDIEPYPDALSEQIKMYLLGSAMGAVQVQVGRIPVHGGAIVSEDGGVIITGKHGAGKSTMTSALVHIGFKYLADDVSSVDANNGLIEIVPSYPQRKLARNACVQLGYVPEKLVVADATRDKFAIRDRENFQTSSVHLSCIIELIPVEHSEILRLEEVEGRDKLNFMLNNLYRIWMHMPDGKILPDTLKIILTIAAKTRMYRIYAPRELERILYTAQSIAKLLDF